MNAFVFASFPLAGTDTVMIALNTPLFLTAPLTAIWLFTFMVSCISAPMLANCEQRLPPISNVAE
jgi:hypothetical protein